MRVHSQMSRARRALVGALALGAPGCGLLLDTSPPEPTAGIEVCDDGVDDDGDGTIDCLDRDCDRDAACPDDCDGMDDDGDGAIDENPTEPGLGQPCFEGPPELAGVGRCVAGTLACAGGELACEGAVGPSEELCDGVDDDCDGALLPAEAGGFCAAASPSHLTLGVDLPQPAPDVVIDLDTTGSMWRVVNALRLGLVSGVVRGILTAHPSAAFGLATFEDFPVSPHGFDADRPFVLRQRITTDLDALALAAAGLAAMGGADSPESGIEALYQLATGTGVSWVGPSGVPGGSVPAAHCGAGFDAGSGHGLLGGACFREEALPIIVHITDARSHDGPDYGAAVAGAAEQGTTMAALRGLGARVAGIQLGEGFAPAAADPLTPLGMAAQTGSEVPVCAFDGSQARLRGVCSDGECCSAVGGAGVAPRAGGLCPIFFQTSWDGSGVPEALRDGVGLLTRFAPSSVELVSGGDRVLAGDASCFVDTVALTEVVPPAPCGGSPTGRDTDADGVDDALDGALPGTHLVFELSLSNTDTHDVDGDGDSAEPCAASGDYTLDLHVVVDGRRVVLDLSATVHVP